MKHSSVLFLIICCSFVPSHPGKKKVDPKDVFILHDDMETTRPTQEDDRKTEEAFAFLQLLTERETSGTEMCRACAKESEKRTVPKQAPRPASRHLKH